MSEAKGQGVTLYFDRELFDKIDDEVFKAHLELQKTYPGAKLSRHAYLINVIREHVEKGKK
jgi:hypothetical protein